MIVCDENIDGRQVDLLRSWGIRISQLGADIATAGLPDTEVIAVLHQLRRPTFFTSDADFYHRRLCHARYCIVHLGVEGAETASYVRRFLADSEFRAWKQRQGKVVHFGVNVMRWWQLKSPREARRVW